MLPTIKQFKNWNLPNKYGAVALFLSIIFWLLPQPTFLWSWIPSLKKELVAEVESGVFKIPNTLISTFPETYAFSEEAYIKKNTDFKARLIWLVDEDNLEKIDQRFVSELSSFLRLNLARSIPYQFEELRGYWQVKLKNYTTTTLDGVVLTLPRTEMVEISRLDEDPDFFVSSAKISIGSLAPQEELVIYAWTTSNNTEHYSSKISLVHSNGIGNARMKQTVGSFWVFLDRYLFMMLFGAWIGYFAYYITSTALRK